MINTLIPLHFCYFFCDFQHLFVFLLKNNALKQSVSFINSLFFIDQPGRMYIDPDKKSFFDLSNDKESALKLLFEKYSHALYAFCNRFLHAEVEAEEIVNDTFLQLWKNRKAITTIDKPKDYLYAICRNLTIDRLRKLAKQQDALQIMLARMKLGSEYADSQLFLQESEQLVEAVLKKIPERKALIYRLSREEGLSHAQIAECMGVSKSRVKNVVVEILSVIRTELNRYNMLQAFLILTTHYFFVYRS